MAMPEAGGGVRALHPAMRWILYAASGLVALAGFQLSVLTEQTETTFAWTVRSTLTAAFLGAAYWSAVPVEFLAARERQWARARISVPGVWTFTALTLVLTVVHSTVFHFSGPGLAPQAAAYLWLGIYALVPIAMLVAAFLQVRKPDGDPPKEAPFPAWLRIVFLVLGVVLVALGLGLFVAPDVLRPSWPWALTTLTARAVGAWLVGIGVAAMHAYRENDFARIRPLGAGLTFFGILELVALGRYSPQMVWGSPGAWLYVLFLAVVVPIGMYSWFGPDVRARLTVRRPSA